MLLVHQAGSVKVGEIVRYTVTYTPSKDRILPTPSHLYVRIKNTSAIPLRAAYLHGPYTLHVCSYPATFNPNQKLGSPRRDGTPEFEPNLKAGGHWHAKLTIPDDIRERGDRANLEEREDGAPHSVKWIIEVASQILFSNTASVHYELLVSRDERSLELGFAAVAGKGHGEPGQIKDFQKREDFSSSRRSLQPKGVYSVAIDLVVEDTNSLWNKPTLPQWGNQESQLPRDEKGSKATNDTGNERNASVRRRGKPKKIHLVVLTHGLHSNVGADMLYLKESIDAAAKLAREATRARRKEERTHRHQFSESNKAKKPMDGTRKADDSEANAPANISGGQDQLSDDEDDEVVEGSDDEQIIVRGFQGNACRTDRGVQYLGKRLAKFVLTTTYPDQPYLPATKSRTLFGTNNNKPNRYGTPTHQGSTISRKDSKDVKDKLPYTFTKISFIGHSLGGLVQTYAVAYIHKHAPDFFAQIRPENFVCMASPLLGLSNENPLYIKFALDFGLVGRTGQDLGLTWRPPNIARTGWSAMVSGFGSKSHEDEKKQEDPLAKPLLRILPTGPAHQVLKMFKNRTTYSNVVNDGIVPLRTSCLLFLDWDGLGKVDNARRENGLIGTMAAFGWAELTGANSIGPRHMDSLDGHRKSLATLNIDGRRSPQSDGGRVSTGSDLRARSASPDVNPSPSESGDSRIQSGSDAQNISVVSEDSLRTDADVPQPTDDQSQDKSRQEYEPASHQFLVTADQDYEGRSSTSLGQLSFDDSDSSRFYTLSNNPLTDFINLFRPGPGPAKAPPPKPRKLSTKVAKTYRRAQTIKQAKDKQEQDKQDEKPKHISTRKRGMATRGDSAVEDPSKNPPPKTSIFDSAADMLNPPLPPLSWLIDPSKRSRTIFHDRVYHPEDIPSPPSKRPKPSRSVSLGSLRSTSTIASSDSLADDAQTMRVEEKIARAYHNGLSWRKVLVRLEPDAHNNMIVRRMFANAYGWDVVKHLCDTHFADTYSSNTADEDEANVDRAKDMDIPVTEDAEEVHGQTDKHPLVEGPPRTNPPIRTCSEHEEDRDRVGDLGKMRVQTENLASGGAGAGKATPTTPRSPESMVWTEDVFDDGDEAEDSDEGAGPLEKFQRFFVGGKRHGSNGEERAKVASNLTSEPQSFESHQGIGPNGDEKIETLLAEDARPDTLGKDSESGLGSTAGLGLRKPPEAHISGMVGSQRKSVSEQVVRSSLEMGRVG